MRCSELAARVVARQARLMGALATKSVAMRIVDYDSDDSDTGAADCGVGCGGHCRTPAQRRSPYSLSDRRPFARGDTRLAAHRVSAGAGPSRNFTATDLLGRRSHELARVSFQPAPDRASGIWLRRVHDLCGGGSGALAAWHATCRRLCT